MSDRSFINSHFMRSHDRPSGHTLLVSSYSIRSEQRLSFFTIDHQHGTVNPAHFLNQQNLLASKVSESLNGIIFLVNGDTVHACNLSTRETVTLPPSDQETVSSARKLSSFRLDPAAIQYTEFFSFGFDPATNQYKILKTWVEWCMISGRVTMQKVLTLGTDSWRPIKCSSAIKCPHPESVCINGTIYFWKFDCIPINTGILAFDVGVEEFRTISLPDTAPNFYSLMKLKDRLTLVDDDHLAHAGTMDMWILEDCQNQVWRQQKIVLPFYWNKLLEGYCGEFFISSIHTGEIIITPACARRSLHVFYFDMESSSLRKVQLPWKTKIMYQDFFKTAPTDCVESILSPRRFCF